MRAELEVARVTSAHGLRGVLRLLPYWAESDALRPAAEVTLELASGERRSATVESVQRSGKMLLVKLRGAEDREAAAALRGARVFVARETLPELAPGEVYLVDLVGAAVVAPDGPVGQVIAANVNPSVDSLTIRADDGRLWEQALVATQVVAIDATARRVELASRSGLFEPSPRRAAGRERHGRAVRPAGRPPQS